MIAINFFVFLIFLFMNIYEKLFLVEEYTQYFKARWIAAPGNLSYLVEKPWSVFTQLFSHAHFGHFAFNMIALYFIGRLFVNFLGERKLVSTYLLGGIFAWLTHVAAYYTFPVYAEAGPMNVLGASGAIMALFAAVAFHKPDLKMRLIFLPMRPISLFVFFALYVLIDLVGIAAPEGESQTAHFAHLGGAIFGWLSVINVNSPKQFMNRIERFFSRIKWPKLFKRRTKMTVLKRETVKQMDDDTYRSQKAVNQEVVDAILDKINKKGYEGLTKKEKEILFNESKRKQ